MHTPLTPQRSRERLLLKAFFHTHADLLKIQPYLTSINNSAYFWAMQPSTGMASFPLSMGSVANAAAKSSQVVVLPLMRC